MHRYFYDTFDFEDQDSSHWPASPAEEQYLVEMGRAADEVHGLRSRQVPEVLELEDELGRAA